MPPPRRSTKRRRGRASEAAAAEEDGLLSLPPEVLDDILIRLGILDAVRTSALSRAWRRRWEALPSLDLCFPCLDYDEGSPKELGAVDAILLRFPGPVRRFRADFADDTFAGRIHDWLRVLSRRGIEILELNYHVCYSALPSSVFSCSRLTSLRLCGFAIPLLPTGFVAFPELRTPSLLSVQLQEYGQDQLEEIIDTSPLLESLELLDVFFGGDYVRKWVIRAPNLRDLTLCADWYNGWILKKLTSLYSAQIGFSTFLVHRNFAKFLSELVQVTELTVAMCHLPAIFYFTFL